MALCVLKVGGALLESPDAIEQFFKVLAAHQQPIILVHGGGALVDSWLSEAGHQVEKYQGLRVSPKTQIPYIVGALAGAANKQLCGAA